VPAAFERVDLEALTSWKYDIRREPSFPFEWHFHPEVELTLIVRGHGTRFVGDSIQYCGPGDLVLLGPNLPHTWHSTGEPEAEAGAGDGCEAVVAQFLLDFLGAELWSRPEFSSIADLLDRARTGLTFAPAVSATVAAELRHLWQRPPDQRTLGLLGILAVLAGLPGRPLVGGAYRPVLDERARHRIDVVCRHICEHFPEHITLGSVAEVASMSQAAFSRSFHHNTGRTFTSYLTEVRVSAARQLLIDTEASVADVAFRCGFRTLSNFNRRFRALTGLSPREYRAARRIERWVYKQAPHTLLEDLLFA
jgi:AraC-like DNA-binding protein